MATFVHQAHAVLQEKGYKKPCHPLDELARFVDADRERADKKIWYYKYGGLFLLTLIPVISALISISISPEKNKYWMPEKLIFGLSLVLTLLTIFNSIFKPSERFNEVCRLGINSIVLRYNF
jgi:hypothetical protein